MRDDFRSDYELFLSDRAEWEREGREQREELLASSLDEFAEDWSAGKSPGDRAALHGAFGAWLYRAARAALAHVGEGWTDDDIAICRSPWSFDLLSIAVPVKVWHGLDDRFVAVGHGRWLAENIPDVQAELREGDGHLKVAAQRIGDVHDWLAQFV